METGQQWMVLFSKLVDDYHFRDSTYICISDMFLFVTSSAGMK